MACCVCFENLELHQDKISKLASFFIFVTSLLGDMFIDNKTEDVDSFLNLLKSSKQTAEERLLIQPLEMQSCCHVVTSK